ncbi:transcription factor IIIB 90 kDa subunit [Macrosteles quadrilineatus]|uniref:transcription factor IIIB 90 kDa subunit n=1 Tax=Macrosteles quadrilineatus TaxID=74068 RepID=UPI0023E0C5BE|nr:transcription factor IIIB 90 kDa subunit [Macrosteles quadrilineatus]
MTGNKCKNCGSSDLEVDPARGDTVCTNCGTVLEDSVIVSEMQFEENAHGGTSALGQFVASDSKGGCRGFGNNFHTTLNRESREITLQNAKRGISNLCQQLRLNQHCLDTAFNFYKMALTRQMTRGRKNTHVLAACVYITCRIEGTPHLLIDFSDVLQIDAFELGRCYLKLSQALCINIPSLDPCLYVLRYANNLEFGDKTHEVTMTALRLVQRMKKDNIHYGRRPSGLCGAALLMAARLHDFNRTVGDIVKIVHIHESTLRKRLVEFGETPSSSLTLDEFMNVDLEEEQDPPSYKAARAKDRERAERLQKMIDDMETESSSSSQISQLQREIERKLEERRALKRPVLSEKNLSLTSSTDGGSVEEVDTDKFVTQSTLGVIHDCLTTEDAEKETTQPVGLGPTAALMGLESNKADSGTTEKQFGDESGELDLVGIDDDDIDQYIMSEHDASNKDKIWMAMNADYLREQKEKEERLEKEREEGKPEKKKRKVTGKKNKNTLAASSAGEAIEKMLQEKKISSKINYDVLKSLNVEGSINPTPTEPQKLPEPEIILPPPKSVLSSKRSKAVPKVQKVKAEVKTEPIKIKEQLKEEIVAPVPVIKTDQSATGESSEADPDLDMEEYEEEELETVEQTLSLSQMLNRHRADDNYYGYDDDDY